MADGTRGGENGERGGGDDVDLSARLRRLGDRLETVAAERPSATARSPQGGADASGMARGMRVSAELVGGVVVGVGIGWFVDRAFGTSPWGLIVFFLLGFAAGVLNVVRSAGVAPGGSDRG